MEINAYQIPQNNDIYIQQNLITAVSTNTDNDSFHIFANQSLSYKRILGQNILPLTTEVGVELNHYFQFSVFCNYTFQSYYINDPNTSLVENFWNCGNSIAVIPYASSIIHPKIKLYGGAGTASGKEEAPTGNSSNFNINYWTLKPVISLETNISESFKFSLGAGYQFIFAKSSNDLSENATGLEGIASFSYNFK